jgi:hypothetical protein
MICYAKHLHTAGYTIAYPEELLIGIHENLIVVSKRCYEAFQ